jgi:light-regulated signal transduction histidine kinase (bacteriophytochrome)
MARYLATGEAILLNKTLELTACNKNKKEFYISLTISRTIQGGNLSFVAFLQDISKEKQIHLELQNKTSLLEYKNIELERTNKELESFNYAASHDLQEPLRKIQIFSSRIVNRGKDSLPAYILSDFDKIIASSARMQHLIEDLLAFSKSTLAYELAHDVDLNDLIRKVEILLADTMKEKHATIEIGKLPVLRVVPFQFSQLFINLIDNALKYQRENPAPRIEITAELVNSTNIALKDPIPYQDYILLRIADNGIGFEPTYAEKIFDPFTRLHSKDKYKGTGIGLSICKKIVHNHEGFIIANSEKGKGSVFSIYLPEKLIVRWNS